MVKHRRNRALTPSYESPSQLTLAGFEHPFERSLNADNRWVVLSGLIPWDELAGVYWKHVGVKAKPLLCIMGTSDLQIGFL